MYRAMVGLGFICAIIIVSVFQATFSVIRENKIELLQRSIHQLFPDAASFRYYDYHADGNFVRLSDDIDRAMVYSVYSNEQVLKGFAIRARGMGYQDAIEVLYAYLPDREMIAGFRVLDSRETPGLGSKIETDQVFLDSFAALHVGLDASGKELEHVIEMVKKGRKQHPWQVDTITGATISSTAVIRIISASAAHWVPLLVQQRKEFNFVNDNPE